VASISSLPWLRIHEWAGPSNARYPLRQLWTSTTPPPPILCVPSQYGGRKRPLGCSHDPHSQYYDGPRHVPGTAVTNKKAREREGGGKRIQAAKSAEGEYQAGLRLRPPSISSPKTGSWGICAILAECGKSEIVKGKESERWGKSESGGQ